jgi:hypothetical protein
VLRRVHEAGCRRVDELQTPAAAPPTLLQRLAEATLLRLLVAV